MKAVLLGFILFAQGIIQTPKDSGTVTGIVRTSSGTPASGVRVSALSRASNSADATAEISTSSLAQTDEQGRYRLENIPPGSYIIAAGRVNLPTYYPSTLDVSKGSSVSVAASAVVANIDITMDDASMKITLDSKGDIELKATGNVKIEGAQVSVNAQSQFEVKGATGTVQSSGPLTVKGAIVNIN